MTSLLGWIAYDSRGVSALYLATDSRVSWPSNGVFWDNTQKIFCLHKSPDVFAYCGDTIGMTQLIGQLSVAIEQECIPESSDYYQRRDYFIQSWLDLNFVSYPMNHDKSEIVHLYRVGEGKTADFRVNVHTCQNKKWYMFNRNLPDKSRPFVMLGSGLNSMKVWYERWKRSEVGETSRSIFSSFNSAVSSREDKQTGGAIQLARLTKNGPARHVGMVRMMCEGDVQGACEWFLAGGRMKVNLDICERVEWRNYLFEKIDPNTLNTIGRRHPVPRSVETPPSM